MSSFLWVGFGHRMLSYILCPRWLGMGLIITSRDAFCVFGVKGGAWSTRGEVHFVSTLVWYGLVNTCCDAFSVRAGVGGFGQHMLRYILCYR